MFLDFMTYAVLEKFICSFGGKKYSEPKSACLYRIRKGVD